MKKSVNSINVSSIDKFLYPALGHNIPVWHLDDIVTELRRTRLQWRDNQGCPKYFNGRALPSSEALQQLVKTLSNVLFPLRLGPSDLHQESEDYYVGLQLDIALRSLLAQLRLELAYRVYMHANIENTPTVPSHLIDNPLESRAIRITQTFASALPRIRQTLDLDILAAFNGDPAAKSVDEVLMCYPGIKAMIYHRIAHELYQLDAPLLARMIAELSHAETGIDIHPGAKIDSGFFIDHGTGVVIGETAVIGKNVRLYQAVTLGAKSFPQNSDGSLQKGLARHPTVEDDVVIYAGATILGNVTIGRGSVIGGNVWLTHSVAAGSYITQANQSASNTHD